MSARPLGLLTPDGGAVHIVRPVSEPATGDTADPDGHGLDILDIIVQIHYCGPTHNIEPDTDVEFIVYN